MNNSSRSLPFDQVKNMHQNTNYDTYFNIVSEVTSGRFNLDIKNQNYEEIEIEEEINDELRPLKNIVTDFVVDEFFRSESSLYLFMQLVYNTFDESLSIYRKKIKISKKDLFFVYKGGNVLRLLSKDFLLDLPSNATTELTKFYTPFFKRSDADFSIYLNPDVENYDKIFQDISLISYLLQVHIRKEFLSNSNLYFDFSKYNTEYKIFILNKYLLKFKDIEGFNITDLSIDNVNAVKNVKFYKSNPDLAIQFINQSNNQKSVINEYQKSIINEYLVKYKDAKNLPNNLPNKQNKKAIKSKITDNNSYMTVTYNSALEFKSGAKKDRTVKFTLVRTKAIFTLINNNKLMNVGGELIDVSIPHRLDTGLIHFFKERDHNIRTFDLSFDKCDLKFKSYSISYLIDDLETILFKFNDFPWNDLKYDKRLNRLFYMYFVDIFIKINDADKRLNIINDLKNMVLIKYFEYSIDIEEGSSIFLKKYEKYKLGVNNLIYLMLDLIKNVETQDHVDNLKKMSDILITNADFIIKTIKNLHKYCQHDGKITSKDIYHSSTKDLL